MDHTKSYKSPDPVVPIQSLYICINRAVNTNCKLGLPVSSGKAEAQAAPRLLGSPAEAQAGPCI